MNPYVLIYREVLEGRRKRFPDHFFEGEQGKNILKHLTQYLIEEHLNIPVMAIPSHISARILWNHRLRAPANRYGWNFIDLIENAYPKFFHPWDVIETKWGITHHLIPKVVDFNFFKNHRLVGLFSAFGDSPYEVINTVYPGEFRPWEFKSVPMNYWKNGNNIKEAMDFLLFERLGFTSYKEALKI
ncbi:hypothetical protein [Paenibacillus humicus]|uniref:hypothetical protein n=1 Tax=Paenibacillus humicus TaxID=412861 RepID=UPI003D27DFA8